MKFALLTTALPGLLLGACALPADKAAAVPGVYFRPNGPYWEGGCRLELFTDGTFRSFDLPSDEADAPSAEAIIRGTYEVRRDSLLLHPRGRACNLATVIGAFELRDGRLCFRHYTASTYECFEKKERPGDLSAFFRF